MSISCSYVLASYARFLWDADDDEEEDEVKTQYGMEKNTSPSMFFQNESHWPPIAAAS